MEVTLRAPLSGAVVEVCVTARENIEAKDLLVILE